MSQQHTVATIRGFCEEKNITGERRKSILANGIIFSRKSVSGVILDLYIDKLFGDRVLIFEYREYLKKIAN